MIKGFIFDMDGVLIDTEKLYNRFWCQAANEFGYPMKFEHALTIRSLSAQFAIPKLNSIFGEEFRYYDVKKRRIELMNDYIDNNGVEIKKGADVLIDYLKGNDIKIAVATSSDFERTKRYLSMVGLYNKIDEFVYGNQVQRSKPMPDIYLEAAKKLNLNPSDCIAVEDSQNGALSAISAGCKTIIVPDLDYPDEQMESKLYMVVDSLDGIISKVFGV